MSLGIVVLVFQTNETKGHSKSFITSAHLLKERGYNIDDKMMEDLANGKSVTLFMESRTGDRWTTKITPLLPSGK